MTWTALVCPACTEATRRTVSSQCARIRSRSTLALAGLLAQLGRWYWLGLAIAGLTALHQQYRIRRRDTDDCFRAFLNSNLFGLAVFGGILLDYLFRP